MALLSPAVRRRAAKVTSTTEHVALATCPDFQMTFVDTCNLEEDAAVKALEADVIQD